MSHLPPELHAELRTVLAAWARGQDPWRDLPHQVSLPPAVAAAYARRRVLVTGGGGFIGSALARTLSVLGATVTALDKDEGGLLRLQTLAQAAPGPFPELALADCRIAARLGAVLDKARPEMVFHCAAHKHLPLLQSQPEEAWLNNAAAVEMAGRAIAPYGVDLFLLLSTDKAVAPTSQLGLSKQAAEHAVQVHGRHWAARPATVRLVNVLASSGSVVECFWRALRQRQPLEVTAPAMERFFISLADTVAALLYAGAAARPGDLFAPRLAAPVRIADLAEATLAIAAQFGLPPPARPPIRFTAPRPGEKLREQPLAADEAPRAQPLPASPPLWCVPAPLSP